MLDIVPSDESIYKYILGDKIKLGKFYPSPFREEGNPSFTLYFNSENKKVYWKDFGMAGKKGMLSDAMQLIQYLYDLSYFDAKRYVQKNVTDTSTGEFEKLVLNPPSSKTISFKYADVSDNIIDYYNQFKISKETIDVFKETQELVSLRINNMPVVLDEISIAYVWNQFSYKLYQPKSIRYKWLSKGISGNLEGGYFRGKDLLIITSSTKDCMALYEAGYDAVAPHNETIKLDLNQFDHKKVVTLLDNDETGKIMSSYYKCDSLFIPEGQGKDPSEYSFNGNNLKEFIEYEITR